MENQLIGLGLAPSQAEPAVEFYAPKACEQSTQMFRPEEHVETIHFLWPESPVGGWS